jgi:hypothetical protein
MFHYKIEVETQTYARGYATGSNWNDVWLESDDPLTLNEVTERVRKEVHGRMPTAHLLGFVDEFGRWNATRHGHTEQVPDGWAICIAWLGDWRKPQCEATDCDNAAERGYKTCRWEDCDREVYGQLS